MILIGIILIVLGLGVVLMSWRGRVVARGAFCKECRFDLAGLDLGQPDSKCPECGGDISKDPQRRTQLRKKSRLGLAGALILLIVGLGTLGLWMSGNASKVISLMPDRVVIQLTEMGVDAALDELVTRVSSIKKTLSASQINGIINEGLTHQSDLLVGFDPRWGEILGLMCVDGYMSEQQLKQYMLNGIDCTPLIRTRVQQGADRVDCLMQLSPSRFNGLTGITTGYLISVRRITDGIVGDPSRAESDSPGMSAYIRVSSGAGRWVSSGPLPIVPTNQGLDQEIGTTIRVYIEYALTLQPTGGTLEDAIELGTFRDEQDVLIIDPSESIVSVIDDEEIINRGVQAISIHQIKARTALPDPSVGQRTSLLGISIQMNELPESLAFRAYLRLENGKEQFISQFVTYGPQSGTMGSGIQLSLNTDPTLAADQIAFVEELKALGKADVILRLDPTLAEPNPDIDQVINMSLIFEDIPVVLADETSMMMWISGGDGWVLGRLLTEHED